MSLSLSGCSAVDNFQRNQKNNHTAAIQRKHHYAALKNDIAAKTLHKGTTIKDLKLHYGAPDDIFYSGSSVSSLQIWTYNVYKDKLADTKLDAVILYIENDQLVSWKY